LFVLKKKEIAGVGIGFGAAILQARWNEKKTNNIAIST